jgi:hypothetical protein
MHWRQNFKDSDKYLGAVDLWDDKKKGYAQLVVTIDKFFVDEMVGSMGKERKVFCKLKEFTKPMVVNVTNFKRLQKLFETVEQDVYLGKPIALGVEKVSSPEGKVDALRFSSRPPQVAQKEAKPGISDDDFPKAIASVQKGSTTIEKLMASRTLTPNQIKLLKDAIENI